jgi:hypothetical protein
MNMKKMIILMVLYLIPGILAGNQFTLDVETGYTDPYPVEPGQNFVLSLQITNEGAEKVDTAYIELEPQHPFTLLETTRKSVSNLGGGGRKILEYNLFVDSSALSTVYEVPVKVTYGELSTATQNVQIRVQGSPQFEILDVKSNEINPGDRETLNIQFENVGTGSAKRMTATFTSSSEDITPIFSGGSVYINEIKPGEKKWIKFDMLASQDAEYKVYTGTVTLKYNDEAGNNHSNSYNIGVLVSGEPKFDVIKSEIDAKDNELEVEVINSGTSKGIAIKAELWIDGNLYDTDYITQVKIDKKSIIKFNLPPRVTSGVLKLYYQGPDNKDFTQEQQIAWQNKGSRNTLFWIIGIGLIIFLVWKKPWKKLKIFKRK